MSLSVLKQASHGMDDSSNDLREKLADTGRIASVEKFTDKEPLAKSERSRDSCYRCGTESQNC